MEVVKECLQCKSIFVWSSSFPHKKFCSKECKVKFKNTKQYTQYEYVCLNCGKKYHPKAKNRNKHCSRKCDFEYRTKTAEGPKGPSIKFLINEFIIDYVEKINICVECGKLYIRNQKQGSYCSIKCYYKYYCNNKHIESTLECKECGAKFIKRYGDKRRIFCSKGCLKKNSRRIRAVRKRIGKGKAIIDSFSLYQILVRDEYRCGICGKKIDVSLPYNDKMAATIDHIIPLSKGGLHCWNNVQAAHLSCNSAKWNIVDYKPGGGR
jgi:5-methylcytosine-specific restriction endonuclease McrA